jgi:hypothetical protein
MFGFYASILKYNDVLSNVQGGDRSLNGVTVDVNYTLHVPYNWWNEPSYSPSYSTIMHAFHGENIWKSESLRDHITRMGISGDSHETYDRHFSNSIWKPILSKVRPRLILEVGVFHGNTSIAMANEVNRLGLHDSFIISMDSWLLDLRFVWNKKQTKTNYFKNIYLGGASQMYYTFLANCIAKNVEDKIIPMQTSSLNGAMALLSHKLRPQFMYIDGSHANPDVFLDLENFYHILADNGVMAFDDYSIPPVHASINTLRHKYNLKLHNNGNQGYFYKNETNKLG